MANAAESLLKLPIEIAGRRDVIGAIREVEKLIDQRLQRRVALEKAPGSKPRLVSGPTQKISLLMELNGYALEDASLQKILPRLKLAKQSAPNVRLTFAAEPEQQALDKIIFWFRNNIHPTVMMQTGIQPSMAGGIMIRTPSKQYDMSIRKHVVESSGKLKGIIDNV